jgi:4-amino-4-deoxy-L-arabinose transferase-like glycosyltransferase
MKPLDTGRGDPDLTLIGQLAVAVSCISFLIYLRHSDLLLYGDAPAHINIARRVFDSRTPGLLQLGTVWLPLPHILMLPFLFSGWMWQTGIGGSIPSMVAYILGTIGMFRLVRSVLAHHDQPGMPARTAAWVAAAVYAGNPGLIYLQTTAMTESLYLAFAIWAIVFFAEFARDAREASRQTKTFRFSPLLKSGLCLAAACLTRYDGWFLAAILFIAGILVTLKSPKPAIRRDFWKFALLAAAVPVLWLAYNQIVYRNPLEFANGPYSAQEIERNSSATSHPGTHDLPAAASYFLKASELNMAQADWGRLWLAALLAGTVIILLFEPQCWPLLLFWTPLPFYMLSVAYAGVPIYVPAWWPLSFYNVRYGLELLPAFAALFALTVYFLMNRAASVKGKSAIALVAFILVAASYGFVWQAQPVCFQEAWINSRTRILFEAELTANLKLLPRDSTLLMYLGDHVAALQNAGIPLRQVINENNRRPWKKPIDPDGLWDRALQNPQAYADYVIAIGNDPVAEKVSRQQLTSVVVIHTVGQPAATVYWTHRSQGNLPR